MHHLRTQLAILLGAFALAVVISLVASTPSFYQNLSLAAHTAADVAARDSEETTTGLEMFDLRNPSFASEFTYVARLVAGLPVDQLTVTGLGLAGSRTIVIDPSAFRDSLRMVFSGSLFMLTLVIFIGLSALRIFLNNHYKTPLSSLVDSINAFSDDPSATTLRWRVRSLKKSPGLLNSMPRQERLKHCSATRFLHFASANGLPILARQWPRLTTTSATC